MSKRKSDHPLTIDVMRSFPMKKIKEIFIENPKSDYGDQISLDKEQAEYLLTALNSIVILNEDIKPKSKDKPNA
jgi:hypothetical protein